MIILGVNANDHDGAAVLLQDGHIIAMVENDRVTRVKRGWQRSPAPAIERCLQLAGISIQEVDTVAVGWDIPVFPEYEYESASPGEDQVYYEWLLDPDETIG